VMRVSIPKMVHLAKGMYPVYGMPGGYEMHHFCRKLK
jgi:hypothetical protein